MKIKSIFLLTLLLLGVSLAREAQAFYNPSPGRWLSRDPIEEQGGINQYAMNRNNPRNFVDFLGLVKIKQGDVVNIPVSSGNIGAAVITLYDHIDMVSSFGAHLDIKLILKNCNCGIFYRWSQRVTMTDEHGIFFNMPDGRPADNALDPGPDNNNWYMSQKESSIGKPPDYSCSDDFSDTPRQIRKDVFDSTPGNPIKHVKFMAHFKLELDEVTSWEDTSGKSVLNIEWGFWANALGRGGIYER